MGEGEVRATAGVVNLGAGLPECDIGRMNDATTPPDHAGSRFPPEIIAHAI